MGKYSVRLRRDDPRLAAPDFPHGENRGYVRGCSCDRCRAAHAASRRRYKPLSRDRNPDRPSAWVDATPARNKVLALLTAEAATVPAISAAAGVDVRVIRQLAEDDDKRCLRRDNEQAILRLTDQMVRRSAAFLPKRLAVQRLRSLQANGWTMQYLARRLGHQPTVNAPPFIVNVARQLVSQETERRVEALYRELGDKPGPSDRARQAARALGWKPPIHYTDDGYPFYDDEPLPGGRPITERDARQRIDALYRVVRQKQSPNEACATLDMSVTYFAKVREDLRIRVAYRDHGQTCEVWPEDWVRIPLIVEARERIEVMEDAVDVWRWLVAACQETLAESDAA